MTVSPLEDTTDWRRSDVNGQHHHITIIRQSDALDGLGAVNGKRIAV